MNNILSTTLLGLPSNWDFWLILVIGLVNAAVLVLASTRMLQMLQLGGYKLANLFDWLKENRFVEVGKLVFITIIASGAYAITSVLLQDLFVHETLKYIGLVIYFVFMCSYIINIFSTPKKTPIKYTKRMIRLVVAVAVFSAGATFGLTYVTAMYSKYFVAGGITIMPLLIIPIVVLAWCVTWPIEKLIANKFIAKAKDKLARHTDVIVVGVTGSYGKTSVKNILASMLSIKYKVCVSPYSYNTPLGLSRTILQDMSDDTQVLVAEMGARNVGDIAELSDMMKPRIGVITGIANQHMATFGSMQAIINTKSELTNYVTEQKGTMFFNTSNNFVKQMYNDCKCKKFQAGLDEGCMVVSQDITCGPNGTTFTLIIDGKKYKNITCPLLGEHHVSNVVLAATVAINMGVQAEQIVEAISKLQPTPHRLQLLPNSGALIVIDDAYNGSEAGAKAAVGVLNSFKGKKVVITPGLVELGKQQFNTNFELGKLMASVCDYVIINGNVNYKALSAGCEFGKLDPSKILRAENLEQAVSMLPSITSAGDVVLFENDLPDNYA